MSLYQGPKVLFSLFPVEASSSGDSGATDIRVGETFFFHRVVRVVYGAWEIHKTVNYGRETFLVYGGTQDSCTQLSIFGLGISVPRY